MACKEVEALLESWGFEDLIPSFKDQDVDEECLTALNSNHLKDLIPSIGKRAKFEKKLKEWQKSKSSAELPADCTPAKVARIENLRTIKPEHEQDNQKDNQATSPLQVLESVINFDLVDILKSTVPGQFVLNSYKQKKILDANARRTLVETVVNHIINSRQNSNFKVRNYEWDQVASQIVSIFPSEEKGAYYIAPVTEGPHQKIAKGKLVDKFRNTLRNLRKHLIENKDQSETSDDTDVTTPELPDLEDDIIWLKYNKEPWPEVVEKWKKTHPARKLDSHGGKIQETVQQWPILKHSLGYTLIEIDFNFKYPGKELLLFTKFHDAKDVWIDFVKIKDQQAKEYLNALNQDIAQECKDACALMLLPALCPPKSRIRINDKGHWKPSIIESREGFILHVKSANDLQPAITRKKEKMLQMGLTVQPFVCLVGESLLTPPVSSYVCVDNFMYKLESPLKAVDVCFKVIHVLNAAYPPESIQIWMLIQRGIYDMKTKWDKQIPGVNVLLSSLNSAL